MAGVCWLWCVHNPTQPHETHAWIASNENREWKERNATSMYKNKCIKKRESNQQTMRGNKRDEIWNGKKTACEYRRSYLNIKPSKNAIAIVFYMIRLKSLRENHRNTNFALSSSVMAHLQYLIRNSSSIITLCSVSEFGTFYENFNYKLGNSQTIRVFTPLSINFLH